jgi:hypothetical protein
MPFDTKPYISQRPWIVIMSEKRRDESPVTKATPTPILDTARENTIRIIDEIAKANPQYSQAISNLQTDFVQTTKNFVQTAFEAQRQVVQSFNLPHYPQISEVVARQSNEVTNNMVRAIGICNQLTINAIDAARENTKIANRTVDALMDFNTNILKAWTNYWASQQQQFTRAY